jgi:hypothetical protein
MLDRGENKLKKSLLLILPIAVVLVAGCIDLGGNGGTTTTEGNGLEIISFTSDLAEVQEGKSVRLTLDLENKGGYELPANKAFVFLTGSNIQEQGPDVSVWNITSGNDIQLVPKIMKPADPARDIPATLSTVRWTVTAPSDLARGQVKTDEFIARTYYDYKTTASGTVWAYSETESMAARDRGEQLTKSSLTSSNGPLQISMTVAPDPVVVPAGTTSGSPEVFTLYITLTNVGGGTVFNNTGKDVDYTDTTIDFEDLQINESNLNVPNIRITSTTIDGMIPDKTCYLSKENVELIGGDTVTLACDVSVTSANAGVKKGFPITITAEYGYYRDSTLSINAVGK